MLDIYINMKLDEISKYQSVSYEFIDIRFDKCK